MLPQANASVIFQKLEEGAVLFAPESELYFGLNESGALIWEQLASRVTSFEALCASVAARYPEIPAATIATDARELLDRLVVEGLARRVEPRESDAAPAS